jgi:glycosyltransferase involved in cell wall biosynthesis
MSHETPRIAVLIPCYNESATIGTVVKDFRRFLPGAAVYVYDNNSSDGTRQVARRAGARVFTEAYQGKGSVVRRMFADIDADIYVMVDGDGTYDAASAPRLVRELVQGPYDLVNAARLATGIGSFRPGHRFGNRLLPGLVRRIFGARTSDMLSGLKAFSRRFAKTFPSMSHGFEIETEIMIHALEMRLPASEIEAPYGQRPEDSASKLHTIRDGFRILRLIGFLVKQERPYAFFTGLALVLAWLSLYVGVPVIVEFLHTGLVPRLPSAVLAAAFMLSAVISFFSGLVLDAITHSRREMKRLAYLRHAPVSGGAELVAAEPAAAQEDAA